MFIFFSLLNTHSNIDDLKSITPFPSDVVPSGKIIKFSPNSKFSFISLLYSIIFVLSELSIKKYY